MRPADHFVYYNPPPLIDQINVHIIKLNMEDKPEQGTGQLFPLSRIYMGKFGQVLGTTVTTQGTQY